MFQPAHTLNDFDASSNGTFMPSEYFAKPMNKPSIPLNGSRMPMFYFCLSMKHSLTTLNDRTLTLNGFS
jgi:hypothetical protein